MQVLSGRPFAVLEVLVIQHLLQVAVAVLPLPQLDTLLQDASAATMNRLQHKV